ncbi:ribosomal protein L14b/L23e [Dioszegia hungarica]|uniref:Large ribosomal subunit protein uL14m n=1 Tax=Dioszegia hungarica TaxID=4972 RepID=A0AA38H5M5_9TREE|nr:ribosomal protein L14b/L23e [Dioszegia hungarica]KAI9634540.1 ribosomal protein L14b/L23e [Dioszegia hungarica]
MIGLKGRLNVIDNSGALIAECINVLKVKTKKKSTGFATVGDEIVCVINKARPALRAESIGPTTGNIQKVRRGDIRRAVVVRTRKSELRPDGRYVNFDDSACVLLNPKGEMIGTRVNGIVSSALRDLPGGAGGPGGRWSKVLALATKVV